MKLLYLATFFEIKVSLLLNRLLNTLTQALQNSGVDLSQANISVQIELGKRASSKTVVGAPIVKVYTLSSSFISSIVVPNIVWKIFSCGVVRIWNSGLESTNIWRLCFLMNQIYGDLLQIHLV